jgi:antirestriction protein ArdC
MNDAVKEIITDMLEDFKQPDSLDRIATHIIPKDDRPCGRWSLLNRLIVRRSKTEDARGFRQWDQLGRRIKKGSKAAYILTPLLIPKKAKDGKEQEGKILIGFKRFPVFKVEDTEGEPMVYPDFTPKVLPPLLNVAKTWGLEVKYGPDFFDTHMLGYFAGKTGDIKLMSHDVKVFFHELAHAGHMKLNNGTIKPGSDPQQEVIAEFAAAILLRMYGFKGEGNAYDYIQGYADTAKNQDVLRACTGALSTVEKVVKLMLAIETGEEEDAGDQA